MTTKTDDQQQAQQPAQQETPPLTEAEREKEAQEVESALEAGFNETRGNTPVEVPAPKKESEPPKDSDAAAPGPKKDGDETPAVPANLIAGITEAQIKELASLASKVPNLERLFAEEIRKVYGKFGELINKIQQGQPSLKISKGALKKLSAEFPDIAEMLEEDLSALASLATDGKPNDAADGQGNPPAGPQNFDARVNAAVETALAQVRETTEKKLLTFMHPTWETDAKTPEFTEFMRSLPVADAKRYLDSEDSLVASECFSKFKEWKAKQQANPSLKHGARKQERLEQAITPPSDGTPQPNALDEEAAFVAGFKEVRSGG